MSIRVKFSYVATEAEANASSVVMGAGEAVWLTDINDFRVGDALTQVQNLPNVIQSQTGSDHGGLSGLGDDDHIQYLNNGRGDARYYRKSEIDTQQQAQDTAISNNATAISNEITARQNADTNLQSQIDSNDNDITALQNAQNNDHGGLAGLGDDDHPQYLNQARGDARYYTQGQLNAVILQEQNDRASADTNLQNQIDTLNNEQTSQNTAISNEVTARQNADTNLQGQINTLNTEQSSQDSAIANNTSKVSFPEAPNDGIQYARQSQGWTAVAPGGVTDHGALSGLLDDDHTQYLNNARGDVRYYTKAQVDTQQQNQNTAISLNTAKVSADGPVSSHSDVNLAGGLSGDVLRLESGQVVPRTLDNGFTIFPIWAEENGGIASGQYEWSFGNGATGTVIGIPIAFDCELFSTTFNAETFGTSVSINIYRRRGGENGTEVYTPVFTANNSVQNPATAIAFQAGDTLVFQTNTVNGTTSDARVCAWFRVASNSSIASTRYSQVANTNIGFTSTAFADVPGTTTQVILTRPGDVWGEATYSAQRSGGTNSVAQFRVVIESDNGTAFPDTLSTFFDNGVADHFLENQPAGTYTVKVQAAVSQPINIGIIALKATAAEA